MSFRTNLLKVADAGRALAGPGGLDQRTNQVTVRTRTWSGDFVGLGTPTDSDLILPAIYPVKQVSTREVSSSGGLYEMGDIIVNHITPSDGESVGFTPMQLKPSVTSSSVEIIYIVTGSHAGEYSLQELRTYRPYSYTMVLRRRTLPHQ